MNDETHRRMVERLRSLHRPGDPLLLVNAWDVASARLVEEAGLPVVSTTSAGVAAVLGYPDGERIPAAEMLDMIERIVRAVAVPVTADLEAGYGMDGGDLYAAAAAAGAAGLNFEDGDPAGSGVVPAEAHAERIAALRAAAAAGADLFVNARTDVFLAGVGEPETRLPEALRRAALYVEAGADGVFVPGVRDEETIGALAAGIDAPLNVLAGPGTPPLSRLGELGVGRVSLGSGPYRVALGAFGRLLDETPREALFDVLGDPGVPSHGSVNELLESHPHR